MSGPIKPIAPMLGPTIANPAFKPISNKGFGIQPMGPSPVGGDMHDSFNVNLNGNISGGHTTVRIKGGKDIHMDW